MSDGKSELFGGRFEDIQGFSFPCMEKSFGKFDQKQMGGSLVAKTVRGGVAQLADVVNRLGCGGRAGDVELQILLAMLDQLPAY